MATDKLYPDKLAFYIFQVGYSFAEVATMLTGIKPGTPEHEQAEREVQDAVRRYVIARDAAKEA